MEEKLRRAVLLSRGDALVFLERPLSAVLLLIAVAMVVAPMLSVVRRKREEVFVGEESLYRSQHWIAFGDTALLGRLPSDHLYVLSRDRGLPMPPRLPLGLSYQRVEASNIVSPRTPAFTPDFIGVGWA